MCIARLAQLVERKTLNLVVVGSSPTMGVIWLFSYGSAVGLVATRQHHCERAFVSGVGLVVRISAFHADGPGSIPGQRIPFCNCG